MKILVMVFKPGDKEIAQMEMNEKTFVKELQTYIGGYFSAVNLKKLPNGDTISIYLDDEGLLKNCKQSIQNNSGGQQIYVGPIVFTRYNKEGDTISLTEKDVEVIKSFTFLNDIYDDLRPVILFEGGKLNDFSS